MCVSWLHTGAPPTLISLDLSLSELTRLIHWLLTWPRAPATPARVHKFAMVHRMLFYFKGLGLGREEDPLLFSVGFLLVVAHSKRNSWNCYETSEQVREMTFQGQRNIRLWRVIAVYSISYLTSMEQVLIIYTSYS